MLNVCVPGLASWSSHSCERCCASHPCRTWQDPARRACVPLLSKARPCASLLVRWPPRGPWPSWAMTASARTQAGRERLANSCTRAGGALWLSCGVCVMVPTACTHRALLGLLRWRRAHRLRDEHRHRQQGVNGFHRALRGALKGHRRAGHRGHQQLHVARTH